jgi:hypothetical protein
MTGHSCQRSAGRRRSGVGEYEGFGVDVLAKPDVMFGVGVLTVEDSPLDADKAGAGPQEDDPITNMNKERKSKILFMGRQVAG